MLSAQLLFRLFLAITLATSCTPSIKQEPTNPASTKQEPASPASTAPQETSDESIKGVPPAPPASPASSGPEADASLACVGCHDYRENHHPTDFVPADPSNFPFPLYNGKVRCLTCHTENHMGSPLMLRGGPYPGRRDICFKCHHEDEYTDIYPHIMLESDDKVREVNGKPVCLVCHAKMPNPKVDRTKDVAFRADVAFLCWRCHSIMSRAILNRHVLMKPPAKMLRFILHEEQTMEVTIPLVPRDRITCSTCHNPHQKGVILYAPSAKGADAPDRLRLQEPDLCMTCHPM